RLSHSSDRTSCLVTPVTRTPMESSAAAMTWAWMPHTAPTTSTSRLRGARRRSECLASRCPQTCDQETDPIGRHGTGPAGGDNYSHMVESRIELTAKRPQAGAFRAIERGRQQVKQLLRKGAGSRDMTEAEAQQLAHLAER